MKRKKTTSIVPFAIVLAACALGAVVFAQGGKIAAKSAADGKNTTSKVPDAKIEIAKADRPPLAYYTGGVRNDLFGAIPQPAPKPKPIVVPIEKPAPPPPPAEVNPFEDQIYSGTLSANGEPMALIENKKTRSGEYYKLGQEFLGGKVSQINDNNVTIEVSGKPYVLAKNPDYNLTPLKSDADFLKAPPPGAAGPQPGMPNMMPGMPAGGMDWSSMRNMSQDQRRTMMQNWMQNMSPEARAQMQQRMNDRQFNGGGGGRNRGGGGGGFGGGGGGRRGGGGGGFGG